MRQMQFRHGKTNPTKPKKQQTAPNTQTPNTPPQTKPTPKPNKRFAISVENSSFSLSKRLRVTFINQSGATKHLCKSSVRSSAKFLWHLPQTCNHRSKKTIANRTRNNFFGSIPSWRWNYSTETAAQRCDWSAGLQDNLLDEENLGTKELNIVLHDITHSAFLGLSPKGHPESSLPALAVGLGALFLQAPIGLLRALLCTLHSGDDHLTL